MITLSTAAFLAFLISLLVTPAVRSLALRTGVVDAAGFVHRKIHATDVPRLGGIALVLSFCIPITALLFVDTGVGRLLEEQKKFLICLLGGSAVIALLGLYDDLRGAGAKLKLLVQTATATAVYLGGFRIEFTNYPLLPEWLGLLSFPITLLWIVGITNALNLIDGLDGLAAGMAFFGVLPMTVLALADGNLMLGLITLTLMSSLLGFLVYNFHPAKIFMGDTGSMFLGFVLALVTVQTSHKSSVAASLLAPVLALGVPILDTSIAVARRAWRGRPLFSADRNHLHHRLLTAGLGHRNAVLALYTVAAGFAAGCRNICVGEMGCRWAWAVRKYDVGTNFLYSNSSVAAKPEMMRRMETESLAIPEEFYCRIKDVIPTKGQDKSKYFMVCESGSVDYLFAFHSADDSLIEGSDVKVGAVYASKAKDIGFDRGVITQVEYDKRVFWRIDGMASGVIEQSVCGNGG